MRATAAFVAGIGNSEPEHWQSRWARSLPGSIWVAQDDWENPVRDGWVRALERDLGGVRGPKVIVAHSLGCLVVAEAAGSLAGAGVVAALLVAVPDTAGPRFPRSALGFRPALSLELPIRSTLVASSDDPYGSLEHARAVARRWGSAFVPVGPRGHINTSSNLGDWPEGRALLDALLDGA
jgi:predicted alpha/beta hydrolase family esterase